MAAISQLSRWLSKQFTTPAAPPAGSNYLYPKSDNKWYTIDSTGAEQLVGPGGGGAVTSVAGKTGAVTLVPADVGLGNVPNVDATNASNISSGTLPDARLSANVVMQIDRPGASLAVVTSAVSAEQGAANVAGYLVIQTTIPFTNSMTSLHVHGYNYATGDETIDLRAGFYPYQDGNFYQTGAVNNGDFPVASVRLMKRTADNLVAVVIESGAPSNLWQYPRIVVDAVVAGSPPDSQLTGWTGVWTTDLSALTSISSSSVAIQITGTAPGTVLEYGGFTAPPGFLMADGSAVSRLSYPMLWNALTYQWTGSNTSGSTTITMADTTQAFVGMVVDGPGCGSGNVITAVTSNTSITLTTATTAGGTNATYRLVPHGNGDGSTTFNLPQRKGRFAFGQNGDKMLSTPTKALGSKGGSSAIATNQLPQHSHSADPHYHTTDAHQHMVGLWYQTNTTGTGTGTRVSNIAANGSTAGGGVTGAGGTATDAARTGSGAGGGTSGVYSQGNTGTAYGNATGNADEFIPPYIAMNFIIKT